MERIPMDLRDHQDPEKLKLFMESCRDEAIEDDHEKVVSISIPINHLDPLAVLDSIYEPEEEHFYIENPQLSFALAGAEPVIKRVFQGPDRFEKSKLFVAEALEHTVAIGDLNSSFSGPHFFYGFTFKNNTEENEPFPAATIFMPHWQVSKSGSEYMAVANCMIKKDTNPDPIVERLWNAYQKFKSFDYSQSPQSPARNLIEEKWLPERIPFVEQVSTAVTDISKGAYNKVVLSRATDLKFDIPCEPLKVLGNLRRSYQNCYLFSFQNNSAESFIGATPERLIATTENRLLTEALAGSEPRGKTPSEDAKLASSLLSSDKDLREHQHVVESIQKRLRSLGIDINELPPVELLSLPNVQHLKTRIEAPLPEHCHLFDLLEVLHPTPAVGGSPRKNALEAIDSLESHQRGLYTGFVGWVGPSGGGEAVVVLRTALIQKNFARIFAGAGIVEGSNPNKEAREIDHKMEALLSAMKINQ